jgi:anti-sigma factor RsiW
MSRHQYQYVDALLDGQLKGFRRRRVLRHVRACPICATEYRRHQHVRRLLQANPPAVRMSDSAELFWSKVKSELERQEPAADAAADTRLLGRIWQPRLAWAAAALAIVALGGAMFYLNPTQTPTVVDTGTQPLAPQGVEEQPPVEAPREEVAVVRETPPAPSRPVSPVATESGLAQVLDIHTAMPSAVATTFSSSEAGVTVIWLSGLPWTPDMTAMQTLFANLDT